MKDQYFIAYLVGEIRITRVIDYKLVRQYIISLNELPDLIELLQKKNYTQIENYRFSQITLNRYDMWEKEAGK